MNTPALVTRSSSNNLPTWNASAPGYLGLETGGGGGGGGGGGDGGEGDAGRHLGAAFRRWWWVMLLIWLLIGVPATVLALKYLPSQYVAKGTIEVSPLKSDPTSNTPVVSPFFTEYLKTQAEMVTNPFVLQRAAEDVRLKKYAWFRNLPDQVEYLGDKLTVTQAGEDIYVSMTYSDAEAAKAIVDSVIDAYFKARNELDEQSLDKSLQILKGLEATTDKSLRDAQATLTKLENDGGTTWSDDDRAVLTTVIEKAKSTLGDLESQEINLATAQQALKTRTAPSEALYKASIPVESDPDIQRWVQEQARVQMADNIAASKGAMKEHPDRIEYRKQLATLKTEIAAKTAQILNDRWTQYKSNFDLETADRLKKSETDLQTTQDQIASLQKHIAEQEKAVQDIGAKTAPIVVLREQIKDMKDALKRYDDRITEIENQSSAPGQVRVLGQAVLPRVPTVHRWLRVAAAANGGGLFLGFMVLVLLMKLRNKIDHAEDLPENFQPLVVGTVSQAAMVGGGVQGGMRRRILGEEMQLLHANLLPPGKSEQRIMMITSPTPANGKTSIASHLALSLAKSGLDVLLIDADLRKRDLTTMFDLGFRPGLAELLQGEAPELVRPMELLPNLRVMGAGAKLERNPVELLQRKHFHEVLGLLHEKFDCIVIDTPPALVVADARLIARSCDEVLCVVRANLSSPKEVNQTLEALTRITGKTPKIVVNGVAHRQTYYKYKYDYTKDGPESPAPDGAVVTGRVE